MATVDHNVPTTSRALPIADEISRQQIDTLRKNCKDFGIRFYDLDDRNQGIVHVIGPELGLTQPGMTIVCGDSHTATHGAFGALAFGIGTSGSRTMQRCWPRRPSFSTNRRRRSASDGRSAAGRAPPRT